MADPDYDALARQHGGKPVPATGNTPDPVGRFREEAWKRIDPVSSLQSLAAAASQPLDAIRGIAQAQGTLLGESAEAFRQGQYGRSLRKGIHGMIPLLGPDMDASAEMLERGDYGGAAGAAAGTLFSLVHPEIARTGVPVVPRIRNLNPLEQKGVDYVVSQGAPFSAGTATGNRYLRALEYASSNTPLGSLVAYAKNRKVEPALTRIAGELAEKARPGQRVSPESAATGVRDTLQSTVDDYTTHADRQYGPWRQLESQPSSLRSVQQAVDQQGNPIMEDVPMPVDIRDIKTLVEPLEAKLSRAWDPAKQYSSRGLKSMRDILKDKPFISSSDAELSLGGLKRLSREDPEGIAGGDIARLIIPELQKRIDSAVAAVSPRASTQLKRGRILTRRAHEVRDVVDDLLEEPVQAYGQMTYRSDAGIERLRGIEKEAPGSLRMVGRAFLEELMDEATRGGGFTRTTTLFNKWHSLGPETKKLLFPNPLLRESVDDFLMAAQHYGKSPNPSGTSGVLAATGAASGGALTGAGGSIASPMDALIANLGGAAVAGLLYSPRTAKLLTQGFRLPTGSTAANALWTTNILREAGQEVDRGPTRTKSSR